MPDGAPARSAPGTAPAPSRPSPAPRPAWQTVAPSPLPEREGYPVPRELTLQEIDELVAAFAQAARRALSVGFEIVEIHGAHGYSPIPSFSPHSNKRSDDFGGNLEKRMRFPLLVAEAVRAVWPSDRPVFYRASVGRQYGGRVPVDDRVALARELKSAASTLSIVPPAGWRARSRWLQQDPARLSGGFRGGGATRRRYSHDGGGRDPGAAAGGGDPGEAMRIWSRSAGNSSPNPIGSIARRRSSASTIPRPCCRGNTSFYLERRAGVLER